LKALGSDMLFPGDFVGCDCDWGIFVAGMFYRLQVWKVLADQLQLGVDCDLVSRKVVRIEVALQIFDFFKHFNNMLDMLLVG